MKTLFLSLILSFSLFASETKKATFNVDTTKSVVKWTGSKPTGTHWGHVNIKSGQVSTKGVFLEGAKITIDMTSIKTKDIKDAKSAKGLDDHLKNADFFDVTNKAKGGHESTLEIKSVMPAKGGKYDVLADLTILNQTKPVKFQAEFVKLRDGNFKAYAKFKFDRTAYGIKYKSKSILKKAADKFINDDIEMDVTLFTKK